MARVVAFIFLIVAVATISAWPPWMDNCGENEEATLCADPDCQATCSSPAKYAVCPPVCANGCKCKEGYVRDAENHCIRENLCPPGKKIQLLKEYIE